MLSAQSRALPRRDARTDLRVTLNRLWKNGDVIEVELPIETRWLKADDRVKADRGRMSVERGPIVYCDEDHDVGASAPGRTTTTRIFRDACERFTLSRRPCSAALAAACGRESSDEKIQVATAIRLQDVGGV